MKKRGPLSPTSIAALVLSAVFLQVDEPTVAGTTPSKPPAKPRVLTPDQQAAQRTAIKARDERTAKILQLRKEMSAAAQRGDQKTVIRISTELLEYPSVTTSYLETRAAAYSMSKNREQAVEDYSACIRIKPTALLYRLRAKEYHMLGDDAKARADTLEAVKLEPKASLILEQARQQMSHEDYDTAIATARRALTMLDTEPPDKRLEYEIAAHDQIGLSYLQLKEYTKARDEFDKALNLTPEWSQAIKKNDQAKIRSLAKWNGRKILRRGECYEKLGKFKEAQADYELVVESKPKSFDYRRSLLRLYRKAGQDDKALALVTQMLQEDDSPDLYYRRSEIYKKLGKEALAKKDFDRARKIEYDLMGSNQKLKD